MENTSVKLTWHSIGEEEANAVQKLLSSGKSLLPGDTVNEFENQFAKIVDAKYAISTSSGTAALEACYLSLDPKQGDNIVAPTFTFHATVSSALRSGFQVRLADTYYDRYHVDPRLLYRGINERTKAMTCVHIFGVPCDIDWIEDFAWAANVKVIEDSAHAFGSKYPDGTMVGSRKNTLCIFSFNAQKPISTIDGGMITTSDRDTAVRLRKILRQGMIKTDFDRTQNDHGIKGYMNELQATIGLVQLTKWEWMLRERKRVASIYMDELTKIDGVRVPYWGLDDSNWHQFPVLLVKKSLIARRLINAGIEVCSVYKPIHMHPFWKNKVSVNRGIGQLASSELIYSYTLSLPIHHAITNDDAHKVCKIIAESV
jgi:dTDP-4-amino-4,6-dideoxygalactose transaminase